MFHFSERTEIEATLEEFEAKTLTVTPSSDKSIPNAPTGWGKRQKANGNGTTYHYPHNPDSPEAPLNSESTSYIDLGKLSKI